MLKDKNIGFAITGSFCSMDDMLEVLKQLVKESKNVYVFVSEKVLTCDNRFNSASELMGKIEAITKQAVVKDIVEAEMFGPKIPLDAVMVYPCTSNTLGKFVNSINDNAVTMACKSTLRNNKNIVLGIYTNDALSNSGKNIMQILNTKNFYVIPMYPDNLEKKPFSMIANKDKAIETLIQALNDKQIQPVFEGEKHD
ncbi:MAG: dipicolinate synthase subunit B [Coprobacillaceae bacterium]